jgi:aspartyl-tRNA(Asn)/glutamyl-tRNA(Gln) amidotransferase subunit C
MAGFCGKKTGRVPAPEAGAVCTPAGICGNLTAFFRWDQVEREVIMSLERGDVERIAHLARLAVEDADLEAVARDLSNILGLVDQLSAVDTQSVAPMAHPLHMAQRLRPDEVTEEDQRERFQSIAPSTESGLYLVPKVIE